MSSKNTQEQIWQIRSLKILEILIRTGADLPVMIWTVGPHGITGEPYSVSTDTERSTAVDKWAHALGAVHWAPHTSEGMTRLVASVKNYNGSGTSILVRTTLYGDEEQETGRGWDSPEAAEAARDDLLRRAERASDPEEAADLREQAAQQVKGRTASQ